MGDSEVMKRQEVLEQVKKQFGTEPDYPWADENAVLRHRRNRKWYAVLLKVRRDRLGLNSEEEVDVLNVKCNPVLVGSLRGKRGFIPAYHMNKDKWVSILLDGSVPKEEILPLIQMSYELTK